MVKEYTFVFVIFIGGGLILLNSAYQAYAVNFQPSDTAQVDTAKILPNYYKNVDIKIIYPWNEDEPEVYINISCQLIKEKDRILEIKIFHKDCTDKIKVLPGTLKFEIRDHESKALILKGS